MFVWVLQTDLWLVGRNDQGPSWIAVAKVVGSPWPPSHVCWWDRTLKGPLEPVGFQKKLGWVYCKTNGRGMWKHVKTNRTPNFFCAFSICSRLEIECSVFTSRSVRGSAYHCRSKRAMELSEGNPRRLSWILYHLLYLYSCCSDCLHYRETSNYPELLISKTWDRWKSCENEDSAKCASCRYSETQILHDFAACWDPSSQWRRGSKVKNWLTSWLTSWV